MKQLIIILTLIASMSSINTVTAQKSFYDFTVTTITGEEFHLSELKGKKVMIVNTASKCGFTPQYEGLEELYKTYKDQNFVIIGFPANNFMKQEPGSDEEIASFCKLNYGVTFPMMSKISVKGKDIHPLYKWLSDKKENGVLSPKVKWNFQKFIIDEEGNLVDYFAPTTKPMDSRIVNWIKG